MRILVSSDLHANIYAAEEAIKISKKEKCDLHIHIGDCIGIGPWPNETIDILKNNNVVMLKGNHEEYCTSIGLSKQLLSNISGNELDHHKWTKGNISQGNIDFLEKLKYQEDIKLGEKTISFLHFFRDNNRISEFNVFEKGLEHSNLDDLFMNEADLIVFGHLHTMIDIQKNRRYISFGSSGCTGRYCINKSVGIIESDDKNLSVKRIQLEWNPEIIRKELIIKKVPDRELVSSIFLN